ncbi:MAG: hypothetical protein WHV44_05185 [Anaerolineales bacterium]
MEQTNPVPASTHSKIGIAAFALGVIPLGLFAAYIAYFSIDIAGRFILTDNVAATPVVYFVAAPLCFLMGVAALITGVWALFQKGRRKALPIAGLVAAVVSFILWLLAVVTVFFYTGG